MNTIQWVAAGLSALTCAAAGVLAGRWWYTRRMAELLVQLDKLERARQVAAQHAVQARRQIEQLQKDIAAQHKARAEARAEARAARKRELSEALEQRDMVFRLERPAATGGAECAESAPHGFADTLPMV
jgi:hypothetical protein